MKTIHTSRIKKTAEQMQKNSLMILIAPQPSTRNHDVSYPFRTHSNLLYLSGFNVDQFILTIDDQAQVHVFSRKFDPLYIRWNGSILSFDEIASQLQMKIENIHPYEDFFPKLPELLKNKAAVYYDFGQQEVFDTKVIRHIYLSLANSRAGATGPATIIRASEILGELRLKKSSEELTQMQRAADISTSAHNRTIDFCHEYFSDGKNKTLAEYQIKAMIESCFLSAGSEFVAYPSIVASGANATVLHYEKVSGIATAKDLILIDAGCEIDGYASDITRSFPAGGKFTSVQKDCYHLVLEAQKAAFKKISKKNSLETLHSAAVHTIADHLNQMGLFKKVPAINPKPKEAKIIVKPSLEEILEKKLYTHFYMHKTSHFLGLDVHDAGKYYLHGKPRLLETGFAFTVEPGVYFPPEAHFIPKDFRGIGIRIEDNIVITADGFINLTQAARKEISELEKSYKS